MLSLITMQKPIAITVVFFSVNEFVKIFKFLITCLGPGNTVVEYLTHVPKIKGLNLTPDTGRAKSTKRFKIFFSYKQAIFRSVMLKHLFVCLLLKHTSTGANVIKLFLSVIYGFS
jgi:hypothetical protein